MELEMDRSRYEWNVWYFIFTKHKEPSLENDNVIKMYCFYLNGQWTNGIKKEEINYNGE